MDGDEPSGDRQAVDPGADHPDDPRLRQWEQRFFWPVVVAAVASLPAMFLTMLDGAANAAGEAINYLTMAVFAAETVVLLVLARDKRQWVREHWFIVAVTALTVPAVVLALGPVQVLRLVRFVGALRIIRVGRILKAGKILYNRTSFSGPVKKGIAFAVTMLAALFAGLVLADPSAASRELLEQAFGDGWPVAVVVAAAILAGATFVVARRRGEDTDAPSREESARGGG